eukprot:scaffold142900_cov15-Tisochrysis_lutea.AAC.1
MRGSEWTSRQIEPVDVSHLFAKNPEGTPYAPTDSPPGKGGPAFEKEAIVCWSCKSKQVPSTQPVYLQRVSTVYSQLLAHPGGNLKMTFCRIDVVQNLPAPCFLKMNLRTVPCIITCAAHLHCWAGMRGPSSWPPIAAAAAAAATAAGAAAASLRSSSPLQQPSSSGGSSSSSSSSLGSDFGSSPSFSEGAASRTSPVSRRSGGVGSGNQTSDLEEANSSCSGEWGQGGGDWESGQGQQQQQRQPDEGQAWPWGDK